MLDLHTRNTFLTIVKKSKRPSCSQIEQKPSKTLQYNEETAVQQIRAQPEEEYKQLMSPIISHFLAKLVHLNDQVSSILLHFKGLVACPSTKLKSVSFL